MARSKYKVDKRQKEIAREKKQELKRQQKLERKRGAVDGEEAWQVDPGGPPTEDGPPAGDPDAATDSQAD